MADKNGRQGGVGLPIGSKIGKYVIREKLGAGGQAIVYKAHDELLDRFVAIKQISTKFAEDEKFLERFHQEAKILARLGTEQPAVISIYELIEDTAGLFIVMEFAEGQSLETILANTDGPIEPKAALQIIWRLAAGLHAVHEAGIIHRDIKPSNIIVGESLRVKITDFGVAAVAAEQTSMLLGTTRYMAPEIFEGDEVDARADIYSLGFIAYEMLAGRPAFKEVFADVMRDRHSEMMRWMKWHGKMKVAAPPLSEVNPDVPEILSKIVAKMMSKKCDDRFTTTEELGRALKTAFSPRVRGASPAATTPTVAATANHADRDEADELQLAPEEPLTAPLPKRRMSFRTKATIAGVIGVIILAIGIFLGVQQSRSRSGRDRRASKLYQQARLVYDRGEYLASVDEFQAVTKSYGGTKAALRASVMLAIARARQAVIDHEWDDAQSAEEQAERRATEIQKKYDSLEDWSRQILGEIGDFRIERVNTWQFVEAMKDANMLLAVEKFESARAVLDRELAGFTPTGDQDEKLRQFHERIDREEFVSGVNSYLAEAADLAKADKYDEAIAEIRQAQSELDQADPDLISDAELKKLGDRVIAALREAQDGRLYVKALDQAAQARQTGKKTPELRALQQAAKLRPSKLLSGQIRELLSQVALDRSAKLTADGSVDMARAVLRKAIKGDPNNATLTVELKKLNATANWQQIVRMAQGDFDAGKYAEALKKYTQAASLRSDPAVTKKIDDCKFAIGLAAADILRDASKYAEALSAYEALREIPTVAGDKIDARQLDTRQRQMHDDLIVRGDAAIKTHQWGEAIRSYREAKEIRATDEVDQRITSARYTENLTKGKDAMEANQWNSAKAYFKTARRHRPTQEVADLLAEVEKMQERQ